MRLSERALWIISLGLLVFFGAWRQQGLQPDAALYAGLAHKILTTHESWRLAGSYGFFPIFFEHPPYFMQWGSLVLELLGHSDGAARAIGGIPGLLGFLFVCFWSAKRFGYATALWTAFILATFTHYTKFAATSMLEAPLSLGTLLGAIGIYESLWGHSRWGIVALGTGLALATASKGVAGLGAFGGAGLSLAVAWILGQVRFRKALALKLWAAIAAAAPLLFWTAKMASLDSLEWISGYFIDQVGRSAVSTRGDASHAQGGNKLFYFKMILLNGWPWWWTVPTSWIAWRRGRFSESETLVIKRWTIVAASFAVAFVVPFSLVQFQLAHYIHPIYLPLAPLGGLFLSHATAKIPIRWPMAKIRWGALALAAFAVMLTAHGAARTNNRGQAFAQVQAAVDALPQDCPVIVRDSNMDAYRMEAYGLWYWRGHTWHLFKQNEAEPLSAADWNPAQPEQLQSHCH